MNKRYIYRGPVLKYGVCIERDYQDETSAPSEKKARNNLVYRYKKNHDYIKETKIELPGNVTKGE